jgi:hypothetical protein
LKSTLCIGLALAAVLLSCAKREAASYREEAAAPPPSSARSSSPATAAQTAEGGAAEPAKVQVQAEAGRKLIRTVDLEIAVKDTDAASQQIQALASSLGGFVSDVNAQRSESLMQYDITLRVPADRLDEALVGLRKLAVRVDREQLSTEDVTDRFVDLSAQVRNLQATETELRALLAESRERGRKVDDVMAIYRELTSIRGQLEQIQGQINALEKLAALSTVHLRVRPDSVAAPIVRGDEWRPVETIRTSLRTLVKLIQNLADVAIVVVIVIVPIVLPIVLIAWLVKRRKRRQPVPPAPPAASGGDGG